MFTYFLLTLFSTGGHLHKLWSNLSLSDVEEKEIVIGNYALSAPRNTLVGRFAAQKTIEETDLCAMLKRFWNLSSLKVVVIADDLFLFEFHDLLELNKVYLEQPWSLDGALLVLEQLHGSERPQDMKLKTVPFWVQIHGLQLWAMTRMVGKEIGERIGEVIEIDCAREGVAWGTCLRVRVMLDVTEPLNRGTTISIRGQTMVVLFRYEKLGDFCNACGHVDHVDKECSVVFINAEGRMSLRQGREYPSWLRAEGRKGINLKDLENSFLVSLGITESDILMSTNEHRSEGREWDTYPSSWQRASFIQPWSESSNGEFQINHMVGINIRANDYVTHTETLGRDGEEIEDLKKLKSARVPFELQLKLQEEKQEYY